MGASVKMNIFTCRMEISMMECNKNCDEIRNLSNIQEDFIRSMGEIMDKLDASQLMVEGNAFDAINSSDTALNLVKEGIASVDELINRITCLNSKIDVSYKKLGDLVELSNKVGELSKVIGTISNRTGVLSVTTSIEAARGTISEVGIGQIAKEMKNLSGETAICSGEMDETVQAIQIFVSDVTETMVNLYEMAEKQNEMIGDVKSVLQKILDASYVSNDVSRNMEHEIAFQHDITDSAMNAIDEITKKAAKVGLFKLDE
jgi:methyl-accepting chemotaxis protein